MHLFKRLDSDKYCLYVLSLWKLTNVFQENFKKKKKKNIFFVLC
jgi:hypothetical protein